MSWRQLISSRVTPWVLIGVGIVAFAVWSVIGAITGHDDPLARRWRKEVAKQTTDQFTSLQASPPDAQSPLPPSRPDWGKTLVAVYSVPTIQPARPRPTLRDLADIGQAHAIDFLANASPTMPRSWRDLRQALVDPGEAAPGDRDPFVFDRTLVATVSKGVDWEPGDRMVWSRVLIQPINFLFAGYTVAATENETIKVTSIEATRSRKFSADLGLGLADTGGPKASIGPTDEHVIKSDADIKTQFEKLGIDITPGFLRIIRESEKGGDVRGNTLVSLSVETDPVRILKRVPAEQIVREQKRPDVVLLVVDVNLEDGRGGPDSSPPSLTVLPQAPLPHCPLRARVLDALSEARHRQRPRKL